jgi:hypothetical protein
VPTPTRPDEARPKLVDDDVPYKVRGQRSTAERQQIGVRLVVQRDTPPATRQMGEIVRPRQRHLI